MKVFVDANIYKLSVVARRVYRPEVQRAKWGDFEDDMVSYYSSYDYPISGVNNDKMREDAAALLFVCEAAKQSIVKFIASSELQLEVLGLPKLDSTTGKLFGAKAEWCPAPVEYSRVMINWRQGRKLMQHKFLKSIDDGRFHELQKATGAFQGANKELNRNQLLDAFHIWCAEFNYCDFFLSVDYKLARSLQNSSVKTLRVVTPKEMLKEIYKSVGFWRSIGFTVKSLAALNRLERNTSEPWGLNFKQH
ncbi:hypothetical protein [Roseobacter sp.]|uniref:hypothetical protein n=1 Tax=Roseobacter sp. TaxID=1907202 RepID=UPI0029662594|nr:hypothetical protein [Roseobacter sp.]MDW3182312.1 hypothetical protein [Roseobacter sp.]